jgi:hypothetical protein
MAPLASKSSLKVFICYRQSDGRQEAEWLFELLNGAEITLADGSEVILRPYLDLRAAVIDDFRVLHIGYLSASRAAILICTPEAAKRRAPPIPIWSRRLGEIWWWLTGSTHLLRDPKDWLHEELDWWLSNRRTGPMLIDATGHGDMFVPTAIKERWLSSAKNRIPRFCPKPDGICGMIATSCLLPPSSFS